MPKASAIIPVNEVNTTPPTPVDTVIIAVEVAFLSPENDNNVVSTLGYIAPHAKPKGIIKAITIPPVDTMEIIIVRIGIAITAPRRIFLACAE